MILNRSFNLCQSWCSQLKTEGAQLDHCGSSQKLDIQWFYISSTYTVISTFSQTIVQVTASLQIPCRRTLLFPLVSFRGKHLQFHSGLFPVQAQPSNGKHKNVCPGCCPLSCFKSLAKVINPPFLHISHDYYETSVVKICQHIVYMIF